MNLTKIIFLNVCLISLFILCNFENKENECTGKELAEINVRPNKGWNTWNTRSVLSHVLLPEGFSISRQLVNHQTRDTLKEALIGRGDYVTKERVIPGAHAWDDAVFDPTSHRMQLADVGLISLYINDCQNLSEIAAVLGKQKSNRLSFRKR